MAVAERYYANTAYLDRPVNNRFNCGDGSISSPRGSPIQNWRAGARGAEPEISRQPCHGKLGGR